MSLARSARPAIFFRAGGHFDPVQFFFHLMKRIVADLVGVAHGENGAARRSKRGAVDLIVLGVRVLARAATVPGFDKVRRQLLPHFFGCG